MDDQISLRDGLLIMIADRDDVDSTTIVTMMRTAVKNVEDFITAYGHHPSEDPFTLDEPIDADRVDDLLIMASHNGHRDIFTETESF